LRYVDDFVLLAPDRQTLETWRDAIRDFLRTRLELELRDDGLIGPLSDGVDFSRLPGARQPPDRPPARGRALPGILGALAGAVGARDADGDDL